VVGIDPAALQALTRRDVTVDLWNSILSVRVADEPGVQKPPLWGSHSVTRDILRFEPRFPLERGTKYRAELDPARLREVVASSSSAAATHALGLTTKLFAEYSLPKERPKAPTIVTNVYPSSDVLPENVLRFYILFSAPMSRGEAYRRIKLLEEPSGKPVVAPFLELGEELWTTDGTRLTLLFDPGRLKQGLKPREELGPILQAGKSYSLIVDREWPDATRNSLKGAFRKTFRAERVDDGSPDPKRWRVRAPRAGSIEPLEVTFGESLDRALLDRLIAVEDVHGQWVRGTISVAEAETVWRFTPRHAWSSGRYSLVVDTELEDVAGNSVARPFEVDVARPITARVLSDTVAVPFEIATGAR
jgi:hypothetical protein